MSRGIAELDRVELTCELRGVYLHDFTQRINLPAGTRGTVVDADVAGDLFTVEVSSPPALVDASSKEIKRLEAAA